LLSSGDVLLGMDGSKVGKNRVRVRASDLPCLLVQRVARLTKKDTICSNFIFLTVNCERFRDYVEVVKTGSAIPHISGGQIKDLPLVLPKDKKSAVFGEFERLASSLFNRTDMLVAENRNLTKLRDTLLPNLISGELRLLEGEQLTKEGLA
jgi:type I restriction enzyme S subunit